MGIERKLKTTEDYQRALINARKSAKTHQKYWKSCQTGGSPAVQDQYAVQWKVLEFKFYVKDKIKEILGYFKK